jgi:CRP/FNR family cyclic AMP-dependent transcriptional regulator
LRQEKIWYLKNTLSLFMGLPEADYKMLDAMLIHFDCKAQEPVYAPGEETAYVYMLKEGRVRVSQLSPDGKEITLDYLEPGAVFGALGMELGEPADVYAVAVEKAFLCKVTRVSFERFIAERPQLMFQITKLLGLRLRKLQIRLQSLLFQDVRTRIITTLEELATDYGVPHPDGTRLRIKLTHQEIANLIGATRETTSQTLSELRADGIVDFEKKHPILKQRTTAGIV